MDHKKLSSEERQERRAKQWKYIKRAVLISVVIVVTLIVITPFFSNRFSSYRNDKAIAIARLNTDGLTSEEIKSKEDIKEEYGYAKVPDREPPFNVTRYAIEFEEFIKNSLSYDTDLAISTGHTLDFNNVTFSVQLVTNGYMDDAYNQVFNHYAELEQSKWIDRFICVIYDSSKQVQKVWEQTNFRATDGKLPVPVSDIERTRDLVDDYQLSSAIMSSDLSILDKYQGYVYRDRDISDVFYIEFPMEPTDMETMRKSLDDYFKLFKGVCNSIAADIDKVVQLKISYGSENEISIWMDKYRCNEYMQMMSQFGDDIGQVYLLQFHLHYGYMSGVFEDELSEALDSFGI